MNVEQRSLHAYRHLMHYVYHAWLASRAARICHRHRNLRNPQLGADLRFLDVSSLSSIHVCVCCLSMKLTNLMFQLLLDIVLLQDLVRADRPSTRPCMSEGLEAAHCISSPFVAIEEIEVSRTHTRLILSSDDWFLADHDGHQMQTRIVNVRCRFVTVECLLTLNTRVILGFQC